MLRAPKRDAVWDEHERLLGLLVDRAAKDSRAAGALASAGHALDRFIDTPGEADGRELAGRLAEAARAFFAAEPLLKRTAYPAGRIIAPDGSLLPPELSKRLAPLGTMGGLAQNILGQLLRTRIDRDGHPAAVAFYGELVRQVSFTMGVYYAAPLEELRCAVGGPRRRGRPAGASASTSGWTEVPATLEGLVELVRSTVMRPTAATQRGHHHDGRRQAGRRRALPARSVRSLRPARPGAPATDRARGRRGAVGHFPAVLSAAERRRFRECRFELRCPSPHTERSRSSPWTNAAMHATKR